MRNAPFVVIPTVAIAALLLVSGCKSKSKVADATAAKTKGASVAVALVQPRDIEESVEVTGTLQPANEVSVGSRAAGKITWIIGKAGTKVRQGQVVARLDDTDAVIQLRTANAALRAAQARLEQAKASFVQQRTATDSGIQNAAAALLAAQARLQQAKTTRDATAATTNAQIRQAEQAYNTANIRLQEAQNGSRSQEKQIAENNKRLAQATLDNDKLNRDRLATLYTQGAVSKSSLDAAETKLQISQAQYDSAVQQLSMVNEGPRQEDVDAAKAAVQQAQAALESARAGLKQVDVAKDNVDIAATGVEQAKAALQSAKASVNIDTMRDKDVLAAQASVQQAKETVAAAQQSIDNMRVYSPVDGVVADKLAEVGQAVGANVAVLKVTTNNALYFEAEISELEATRLHAGQVVYLTIDALQGDRSNVYGQGKVTKQIAGMVERVVPVVDAKTRNFTVRVVVADTPKLFPGMFARGQVVLVNHPMAIAVPKVAIVDKDNQQVVFVADDNGIAHKRTVTLGATDGDDVQVISGVNAGDKVITAGQQSLADGDAITISQTVQE
ncbi:MAG TPA: efflux RND transporter periplasmic adaptor subunit [Armatimonadota bacterium]|nr:efflux RND transporter periplasmic adaptor subunit [Armatimonadota bacterium]